MVTTNYTDLRKNLKTYLDAVVNDSDALVVHRPKNTSIVVISLDDYNAIKETEYIMSSSAMTERLKQAENSMIQNKGTQINIDEL